MTTNRDLCEVLADALGIERDGVLGHARALFEAKLFPGGDDGRAGSERAAILLIALMTGAPPDKSPDAVRLYANLPLARARRYPASEGAQAPEIEACTGGPLRSDMGVTA